MTKMIYRASAQLVSLFLFSLLVGCGSSNDKVEYVDTGVKDTLEQTLDSYLDANIQNDKPGMAILVVDNQQIVYNRGAGMANINTNTLITRDTGFRLASVSKSFTALAIMQLVEAEQISLDNSIIDYLPELPASWNNITIHHLLTHQSGIKDYGGVPDGQTNQDILDYYTTHPDVDFSAGTDRAYSNPGFHLLAEVIERVSGVRFEDYMQQNILTPLNMTNSYVADEYTTPLANDALNYAQYSNFHGRDNFTNGANAVVSSLNDMNRYMDGLLNFDIVSQESLDLMLEHHTLNLFDNADYGYGFILVSGVDDPFYHSGGHDGFKTFMYIDRVKNRQIVFLGNGGQATSNHGYLLDLINQSLDQADSTNS